MDESIFLGVSSIPFVVNFIFEQKFLYENSVDPDQTPWYVASDLGLLCLPMSL